MLYSHSRIRPAYALLEEAFARYVFRQIDSTKGIESVKVTGAEAGLGKTLGLEFELLQRPRPSDRRDGRDLRWR